MGQPAARVTDMHTCPMVTGVVPHVGGPIIPPCQFNVLTCAMPQARITDMAICVGPIDMIIQGAFTVLVGGLPAARMGDMTVHGGVIVTGCFTVLIGDDNSCEGGSSQDASGPTNVLVAEQENAYIGELKEGGYKDKKNDQKKPTDSANYGKAIKIKGSEEFQKKVLADLAAIKKTVTGAKLLDALDKSGKTVMIEQTNGGNSTGGFTSEAKSKDGDWGNGSDSTIKYNPDLKAISTNKWGTRPPAIGLAHELIHSKHAAEGSVDTTKVDNDSKPDPADPKKTAKELDEEVRAVGLPPHEDEDITENNIRNEWDPPQSKREWY
jgi:type VI secretion system secreted protein VgrG